MTDDGPWHSWNVCKTVSNSGNYELIAVLGNLLFHLVGQQYLLWRDYVLTRWILYWAFLNEMHARGIL